MFASLPRRWLALVLAALLAGATAGGAEGEADAAHPLEPAASGGLAAVDRGLLALAAHRRLLVIGAHPDDEDNTLLTWVSRGLGGEAAYFALSRGEGGQNLIGPELGVGLGLVRTGELLAARRLEGTRQLFGRAFDFGYTRSLQEASLRWPREAMLQDAVRAVRRFKPQVVVAIFPGDERAGHGQHQLSGAIAVEAFAAAGEEDRFPAMTAAGMPPWRPQLLYRRAWSREEATHSYPLGSIEPFSGRSLRQMAVESRSLHRSQDMGAEQRLGQAFGGLIRLAGEEGEGAPPSRLPFSGVDTRLEAIAAVLPTSGPGAEARREVGQALGRIARRAAEIRSALTPSDPGAAVPGLADLVSELAAVSDRLAGLAGELPAAVAAGDLVDEKLARARAALTAAAGVVFDALADREAVAAGDGLEARVQLWNSGAFEVEVEGVELTSPAGWRIGDAKSAPSGDAEPPSNPFELPVESAGLREWRWTVSVPPAAEPTVPYFLRHPRAGGGVDVYDWSDVAESVRGLPWQPPPLLARLVLRVAGAPVVLEREVVYRWGDQAFGERRGPLRAVPPLEVAVRPELLLRPMARTAPSELEILLVSNVERPLAGRVEIALPEGWAAPGLAGAAFRIDAPYGRVVLRSGLAPRGVPRPGSHRLAAAAILAEGGRFAAAYPRVEYPHVRPVPMPVPAEAKLRVLDLALPPLDRLGYVRGASDRVPEMLREVGLPVELLDGVALATADLTVYDAIVVGSRAYETDETLRRNHLRLADYVRGGGLLVVQYQQYSFVRDGYALHPLIIGRPHGRVTDETSPVRLLEERHPVLTVPNRIGDADWLGWVQERGLYFAESWDPAYTSLLALADPGREEERGALLVARFGAGRYVYTGLSFFRQLPAGVPGPFRLFANLLAWRD